MKTHAVNILAKAYPYVFGSLLWCLSVVPLFKTGLTPDTLQTDFLGRPQLIEAFNTLRLELGDRAFPTVLVGKNGWLYYSLLGEMADYQHTNQFSTKQLKAVQLKLDAMDTRLTQAGIVFLVVIPPDKATIYPQFVPAELGVRDGPSRLEQLIGYMRKYGKTPIVDLRADLRASRNQQQLYFATDLHWNQLAAYIAYAKLLGVLSQRFPTLTPHPLSDFQIGSDGVHTRPLASILGLPYIQEAAPQLIPTFSIPTYATNIPVAGPLPGRQIRISLNQDQTLPKALIYHDSFFLWVLPLLEPHFSETISLYAQGTDIWNTDWVNVLHPDVVILEISEFGWNHLNQNIPELK